MTNNSTEALRKLVAARIEWLTWHSQRNPDARLSDTLPDDLALLVQIADALEPLLDASERAGASVADGWRLVPVEPTEVMNSAAQEAFPRSASFVFPRLYAAMIAAAPQPPGAPGVGWRPIESAPRDGTPVDLWKLSPDRKHGRRIPDAKWDTHRSFHGGIGHVALPDSWVDRYGSEIHLDGGVFTHWQPLPEPPHDR